jgi:hypothetical protein
MRRRILNRTSLALAVSGLLAAGVFASTGAAGRAPAPTLQVSFSTFAAASVESSVPYGTPYLVSGCGYGTVGVTVVVHSPEAISFAGQVPDANGCISVGNFSTQGPGHYDVAAYQELRNKSSKVASMSFDLS